MKRKVCLSLICATILSANENITVDSIEVNETITTKVVSNVSSEEIKSADLAEALSKNVSSISLVRRSGIANDILLRGQKRDNINVLIDGAKIYGACPNRMDPPTSHILSNNVESVIVNEGPFDVENFGTLSGVVNVQTKAPQEGIHGEINLNAGSFGYKKGSLTLSGGNEFVKAMVSMSKEESEQYKDGNGDTFYEQQIKKSAPTANQYKTIYQDMDAYEKKTLLTKLYFNLTDDQDLKLSYTANRSDNVLYPNTGMDALRDDSDIYTVGYTVRNLGELSKELNLDYYYSKVEHPMSTEYRNASSGMMGAMVNDMESKIQGFKIKNSMTLNSALLSYGIDTSKRSWEGEYSNKNGYIRDSISPTDTKNKALFAKYENDYDKLNVSVGMRYDDTSITTQSTLQDNDYNAFSGNVFTTFNADENSKYFIGIGKSVRVPDARELYNISSSAPTVIGTPTLDQTKNYEIDLGFEKNIGDLSIKTKMFYSVLKDYIYYNKDKANNKFENIDAKIYGIDISGVYFISDSMSLDYGMAYQRGKKDEALAGQNDRDLADITPLKANIAVNYEYEASKFTAEVVAAKSWSSYDEDNGEQELSGYGILNLKYNHTLPKGFDVTVGVDNVFDKTYAVSNTYSDLTLISTGTDPMLLNEPGRYAFLNLRYKF